VHNGAYVPFERARDRACRKIAIAIGLPKRSTAKAIAKRREGRERIVRRYKEKTERLSVENAQDGRKMRAEGRKSPLAGRGKLHPHRTRHDSHHSPPLTVRRPLPRARASWNMHDMLMRLVPNLIIQFHRRPRQPPDLPIAPPRVAEARAHAHAGIPLAPHRHVGPAFLMTRAI